MRKYLKNLILTALTKHLLSPLEPYNVFTLNGDKVLLGGEEIIGQEAENLRGEAKLLKRMRLWAVFQETLKQAAYKSMFEKSNNFDDVLNGKLMIYNLDVQRNIVEELAKEPPKMVASSLPVYLKDEQHGT
ncbi:hypothetical protein M1506_00280 [Patescibacteria group bacterium]|nr:hypothetical protein [Patescibacteria group bacterium]